MFVTVDDRRVFVSDGGQERESTRPTLVLIHGSGADHSEWALQMRYMAHHGINVAAVDLPGHGLSDGPPLVSVGQMADWLKRFLDTLGEKEVSVLGHSLGALVAVEFAARYPDRCRQVLLAGVAERMAVHPALLDAARRNDALAVELLDDWCHAKSSQIGGHPVPGGWMTGGARRLLHRAGAGVLGTDLGACDAYSDMAAAIERLRAGVTIIAGREDRMTPPKAARALAERIPGARFETIDSAGHNMMIEQPARFNRIVRNVLNSA